MRVAVVNDYELIVDGMASLLGRFPDRILVVDRIIVGEPLDAPVDVALYDTYGRRGLADAALRSLVSTPLVRRVAVFSLDSNADLVETARACGAHGVISKALPAEGIVEAIIRVSEGSFAEALAASPLPANDDLDWPGKDVGLTERESQVLVLVAEGLTNREVAEAMKLGVETVKSYFSQVLAKLGARNRVEASAYALRSGAFRRFQPYTEHSGG